MDESYSPELDDAPFLNGSEALNYQTLIGCLVWIVTPGRFDVHFAISALAGYPQYPMRGHYKAALRVFGYLKACSKARIKMDKLYPLLQGEKEQ